MEFVYKHGVAPRKTAVKCNSHHRQGGACILCKICAHLNQPHTVLHLNRTHVTTKNGAESKAFQKANGSAPFTHGS